MPSYFPFNISKILKKYVEEYQACKKQDFLKKRRNKESKLLLDTFQKKKNEQKKLSVFLKVGVPDVEKIQENVTISEISFALKTCTFCRYFPANLMF